MIKKRMSEVIHEEILKGREGKTLAIPVNYDRVSEHIDIGKNRYYVIAGSTGTGKSTLALDMFLLEPIKWYLNNKDKHDKIKLSIIYFGMERNIVEYVARFLSRLIFLDQGILIEPKRILCRSEYNMLTESEFKLVQEYYTLLDEWESNDILMFHSQSQNPTGISMVIDSFAKKHGVVTHKNKEDKSDENITTTTTYKSTHPNHIVLIAIDHIAILKTEQGLKQKELIDNFSKTMRDARDVYGFSPVIVQQLNRSIANVNRAKLGELVPTLFDLAETSTTSHDADCVLAIFNPYMFIPKPAKDELHNGFSLIDLKDDKFRTYYRTLHILKNTYGSAGFDFPMALYPIPGIFKTLPRSTEMNPQTYKDIIDGRYFLQS